MWCSIEVDTPLIRDGELSGDDRTRARQLAEPCQVADKSENGDKNDELEAVACRRARNDFPHQPQGRLGPADRPDRAVEVAALVPLVFGRRLHAWQTAERTEEPNRPGERKVRIPVDLLQVPLTGDDRDEETGDIQDGERDHLAPRERVAHAAIERVRTIYGEADDVRLRFDARQRAAQAGDAGGDEDRAEPE